MVMLRPWTALGLGQSRSCLRLLSGIKLDRHYTTVSTSDPLRVLFCGSNEFSIASLRAVHLESQRNPSLVESVDVLCRPPKPAGRGLKIQREVAIAKVARELALPLYQIDSFSKWQPPLAPSGRPYNLIIAVSFGLLVPPRILGGTTYGGLNVHPSMLPDFRGAAPLHHMLLHECETAGITLQTLHPTRLDHGQILLQTPRPGFLIPSEARGSVERFAKLVAPMGAEMLLQGLRERLFVPPVVDRTPKLSEQQAASLRPAPKITPRDRHIDWAVWSVDEIVRRHRVVGPLWSLARSSDGVERRVIWAEGLQRASGVPEAVAGLLDGQLPGFAVVQHKGLGTGLYALTADKGIVYAPWVVVEGSKGADPRTVLQKAKMVESGEWDLPWHADFRSLSNPLH